MPTGSFQNATTWRAVLCGVLLFLLADVTVFRSWLYAWISKPESSVGWVARRTLFEPLRDLTPTRPGIALLGDSTMSAGCSAERLQELLGGPPVTVRDGSIPGTPMRVWPFVLAELTPPRDGWTLVVIGLQDYDDDAQAERMGERVQDLAFLGPLMQFADATAVAADFTDRSARGDVWLATFCKTYAWRRDVQDLCASPWQRYQEVRRQFGRLRWGQPYEGENRDLVGVRVEGDRIVGLGPEDTSIEGNLRLAIWPPPGVDNSDYRRRWLNLLADHVTAAGAELVVVRMPMQALPRAIARVPNTKVIDELRQRSRVHVLDVDLFAELEQPDYFFDGLHLNRRGRERFTALLAAALRRQFPAVLGR